MLTKQLRGLDKKNGGARRDGGRGREEMTEKRAQGSSLDMECVYFDHCYPPERGYGSVGASRFHAKESFYHYGRLRRTDWLLYRIAHIRIIAVRPAIPRGGHRCLSGK